MFRLMHNTIELGVVAQICTCIRSFKQPNSDVFELLVDEKKINHC
jgi:hypothetical protein